MTFDRTKSILLASFLIFCSAAAEAQNKIGKELHIKRAKHEIVLDGILDEPDWADADSAVNWFLNYPIDTALSPFQSAIKLTFNEHMLYAAFVCQDDESPDIINSLRRDFDYDRTDNIGMYLGPYNDAINGFFFLVTPKGIQMEGTINSGGSSSDSYNIYWDNKWYSKGVRYKNKWIVEVAIPFKSFRYKSGIKEWNISFDRQDKKRNLRSSWIHTPIQYPTGSFAYSGQLVWDDPIPPPHPNVSIIPFVAGGAAADNTTDPKSRTGELQTGFDGKISVTPSLNLDLTVNPDFSQVEVDQQVINLTRFEFKFPERRQFFLENNDLFDKAGFPESRIFFSRRIGLVKAPSGLYTRVPIAFGARLSGSINKKWRLSVMNMQTREKLSLGLPGQNYTVATLQRNFWRQSNVSITYVDKESLHVGLGDSTRYFHESVFQPITSNNKTSYQRTASNKVLDGDMEVLSKDNKWYYSGFIAQSFSEHNNNHARSGGSFFQYAARKVNTGLAFSSIGKNFNAEAGYVPSHGVYPGQNNYSVFLNYIIYPSNRPVVLMGPQLTLAQTTLPDGTLTDKNYTLGYNFNFRSTASLLLTASHIFQRLTSDFNPVDDTKYTVFKTNERYSWNLVSGTFQSNTRKVANFTVQSTYGGFYNGHNLDVNGQINYRYQPYGNISLRFDYNDLRLAGNYGREKLFLIGPRIDLTFTEKIFLTTYVQYNKLLDNMNVNARFQWRYKPASDFFIVYTENYLPESFASKNRSLVFKLTYWLNI